MKSLMKTTKSVRPAEVEKKWHIVDANGLVVGRTASIIANIIRGKHKPSYTPHVDCGDVVVVINADRLCFTGKKWSTKKYYKHTGYPGGLKVKTAQDILDGNFPERLLELAVKRMMPDGPLARKQMKNLRIFAGSEHPHEAQQPELLDIAGRNRKNSTQGFATSSKEHRSGAKASAPLSNHPYERSHFAMLERLILALDHHNADDRSRALRELADLLPLPLEAQAALSRHDAHKLRRLPMRLLRALLESTGFSTAAYYAAIALVKATFPMHYQSILSRTDLESRAAEDFRRIVEYHDLQYFWTMDTQRNPRGTTQVEAIIWSELPFTLNGERPALNPADWVDPEHGLSIRVVGADLIDAQSYSMADLKKGQILACTGEITPSRETNFKEIIVYLYNGNTLLDHHVFPQNHLFKHGPAR
jgi:large subunit ribosomal protein L13